MSIVILTYESLFSNLMIEALIKTYPDEVFGIVHSDFIIQGKSFRQSLLHLYRHTGLRFIIRKAFLELQFRALDVIVRLNARRAKVSSLREMGRLYGIPIIGSKDVNSPQTLARIRAWNPDVIFSIYLNQLIKP